MKTLLKERKLWRSLREFQGSYEGSMSLGQKDWLLEKEFRKEVKDAEGKLFPSKSFLGPQL